MGFGVWSLGCWVKGLGYEIPRRHRSTAAHRSKGADNDNARCAAVATDRHHVFAPVHDEASVGEYEGGVLIVRGLGFGVWGLGFGVWGLGFTCLPLQGSTKSGDA